MKYRLIAVTAIFNAGEVSDSFTFDTFDELQEFYQETISKMDEEEAEWFDFHSRIEEVEEEATK